MYLLDAGGTASEPTSLAAVDLNDCSLLWVDLEEPTEEEMKQVGERFGIHPLALDESKLPVHPPKILEFPDHLFVMWNILRDQPSTEKLEMSTLSIFLGRNYLVTVHQETLPELDEIYARLKEDPGLYRGQPSPLLYAIFDTSVNAYFPLVEDLTESIDKYMESLLTDQGGGDLKAILGLKHRNMAVRRAVSTHRDIIMQLARRDMRFIPEELTIYLIDLYDHLVRIGSEVDNNSDLVSSSLDIHLNAVSNRLNVTMKRLTTIATIFMPLTFLVGLWGMNFRHIPEFGWHYGYLFAWVTIIVVAIVMVVFAWKKDWF